MRRNLGAMFSAPGKYTRRGVWLVILSVASVLPIFVSLYMSDKQEATRNAGLAFLLAAILGVAGSVPYFWKNYRQKDFHLESHYQRLTIAATALATLVFVLLLVEWLSSWDVELETRVRWVVAAAGGFMGISAGYAAYASEAEVEHHYVGTDSLPEESTDLSNTP